MGARSRIFATFMWCLTENDRAELKAFLIGLGVFLLILLYRRRSKQSSDVLPGYFGWKLYLLLPSFIYYGVCKGLYFHELLIKWGRRFPGIFSFGAGTLRIVVIDDWDLLKEAWKHPHLNDRAPNALRDGLFRGKGLLFGSGETWREQRRFSLTVLRSLGVGKRSFEKVIATESQCLTDKLRSFNGKPFDPTYLFSNAVANVICSVTFGKRYSYDDEVFRRMLQYLELILEQQIPIAVLTEGFPWTKNMTWGPIEKYREYLVRYRQGIRDVIQEHRRTFDENNLRDFIDVYFHEMSLKEENYTDTKLNEENMESTVEDLFLAGSETTSTSLRWSALLMIEFPDIQARVQRELDDVVGRNRLPSLADRPKLVYTECVIQELARFTTIAPIAAPHYCSVETEFCGYKIPKDTMIIGNIWKISRDKKLWNDEDLNEFKPERFLDENSNCVNKPEHHIIFGSGKRSCIGEHLAKMEVYIFITHILHQFTMRKPRGAGVNDLRGKPGAVHHPFYFEVCLEPRKMAPE